MILLRLGEIDNPHRRILITQKVRTTFPRLVHHGQRSDSCAAWVRFRWLWMNSMGVISPMGRCVPSLYCRPQASITPGLLLM